MLLEFRVQNFRSLRSEALFSFVAEPSRSKDFNLFSQPLPGGDVVRMLKVAGLYGANASGKSNFLRAMFSLRKMLLSPPKAGAQIRQYEPFLFDKATRTAPTVFELTFLGPDNIKFEYYVKFDRDLILEESLHYYPIGNKRKCFHRIDVADEELYQSVTLGGDFRNRRIRVFRNQLLLSRFGQEEPDDILSEAFLSIAKFLVVNACDGITIDEIRRVVHRAVAADDELLFRLNALIQSADIRVQRTVVKELSDEDYQFPPGFSEDARREIIEQNRYRVFGIHKLFEHGKPVGEETLDFLEESNGTNVLFVLGGLILMKLDDGGVLFVDELDTSLHPRLTRLLVSLFQNKRTNPRNAQLIFSTHDTNLLDSNLLRKDQIWFADKDEFGGTELYSMQDFDGVRESTAFERWYQAGKFGAVPDIGNSIFTH